MVSLSAAGKAKVQNKNVRAKLIRSKGNVTWIVLLPVMERSAFRFNAQSKHIYNLEVYIRRRRRWCSTSKYMVRKRLPFLFLAKGRVVYCGDGTRQKFPCCSSWTFAKLARSFLGHWVKYPWGGWADRSNASSLPSRFVALPRATINRCTVADAAYAPK
jgi:hypothetical protein